MGRGAALCLPSVFLQGINPHGELQLCAEGGRGLEDVGKHGESLGNVHPGGRVKQELCPLGITKLGLGLVPFPSKATA